MSSRYDQEEYCDENERTNESPVDSSQDYSDQLDWKSPKRGYKRRNKRELFARGHRPSAVKHFLSSVEDNEDLWTSNGGSIYIPTITGTAIHNHKYEHPFSTSNHKKQRENAFPTYALSNDNVPILAPSSFAFSQIPVVYKPKTPSITSLFRSKNKSTFNLQANEQTNGYSNRRRPSISNLYPSSYDQTNLDNLAENADYPDEMNNRKEELDLEHREKASKEPHYFDDEFEDEMFNSRNFDKDLKTDEFKKNFDKNFDKEFKPRKALPSRPKNGGRNKNHRNHRNKKGNNRPLIKQKIDTSQLEREDDLDNLNSAKDVERDRQDTKEQKLVRITRQITVYNKNLFKDQVDLTGVDNGELLDGEMLKNDLLDSSETGELVDSKNEEDLLKKSNLPRLKKKKRMGKKGKRKQLPGGRKKKTRKRIKGKTSASPNSKRKNGNRKRRGTKSRSLNLISEKDIKITIS